MILKNKKNSVTAIIIISVIVTFLNITLLAQQEIPDPVRDLLLAGIKTIEEAKEPADIDNALLMFIEVNRTAPEFADVHYYLGKTLAMLQGNTRNAVNELKKYLELYPEAPDKEIVEADIMQLEEDLKSKRKSSLMGIVLVSLPDGIYINSSNASIHRVGSRFQSLYVGDKILAVDDVDVTGMTLPEVLSLIDSKTSENIKLTIIRSDEQIEVNVPKKSTEDLNDFTFPELGEDDLDEIVKTSAVPLVVLWTGYNCIECEIYLKEITVTRNKYPEVSFLEVDLEENKFLDYLYEIDRTKVPVIIIYKDGKQVDKFAGYKPGLLKEKIDEIMK